MRQWSAPNKGLAVITRSGACQVIVCASDTRFPCYHPLMGTATLVGVEEYLSTSYRPDCDYVDGEVTERNVGQKDHSKLQVELATWFRIRRTALRLGVFTEQRIRVAPGSYRIPDVCVTGLPEPDEQVFAAPPYICIEILTPEDTFPRLQTRLDDYLAMGVPNVWVLDPASRRAWIISRLGHLEALDGFLRTADERVAVPIADLFNPED